ncbi:GIP, partial [Symbiodinium microadriaticum]
MRNELMENGFVLPEEEESVQEKKVTSDAEDTPDFFVEPEDIIHGTTEPTPVGTGEDDIGMCKKVAVENLYTRDIEKVLKELEGDLRVVHTVHPSEVEQNIEAWIPSMAKEMKTLEEIGAVKRLKGKEARDYLRQTGAVVVPGKAVYTVKPPSEEGQVCRRKTRIVSCGNFQPKNDAESNYSGGAVAEAVRLGIAEAARHRWCACTGDIVSAFLRAPVPKGTCLALRPPMALIKAGLADREEVWVVQTALYGFRSSPRWWSTHRTAKMKSGVTKGGLTFRQGQADADVWQIQAPGGITKGLMIVYVDDFLILGPRDICDDAYDWMATTWEEWMVLDPQGYPDTYTAEQLKAAQSVTGELAWLAQRCRPDLSYTVSIMGSLTTKDPVRVATIGRKTMSYLNATKEWKLMFRSGSRPELITYTDSSYSPEGERSHSGAVVFWANCPVAWKSGRQSLVTTSSAETELLAASEGATLTYSIDAMLNDVGVEPTAREIRVDNTAAVTLASEEGGSWRTRHLKVRAAALRQRLQDGWARITHCPGEWQLADGLTKILASKRMEMLMAGWGLGMAASQESQRLTKVELRTLSALLQREPEKLTSEEKLDLVHLAGRCGSDVSEAVGMNVVGSKARGQPRTAAKDFKDVSYDTLVELGSSHVDREAPAGRKPSRVVPEKEYKR